MTMKQSSPLFDLAFFALIALLFAFAFFGLQGWLRHSADRPDPHPLTALQVIPGSPSTASLPVATPGVKRQTIS
ncbi:MAG: hypothetical protein ACP5MM_08965 [Acidithiobacillus sp.]|uniref:hypothetical protein n=1 Tax=Acidithiobacillus sp. TaxID=1872118 RepID=UPI003D03FE7D